MKCVKAVALAVLAATTTIVLSSAGIPARAVAAPVFINGSSAYQAVAPSRLADTRPEQGAFGFTRISDNVVRVKVAGNGGVPTNASAAVLNVTGVNTSAPGYITVYPSGTDLPTASNVNFERRGRVMANMVTVKLGVDGSVDVYMSSYMDAIVDVSGAYVPVSGPVAAGRLTTLAGGASRVLDTRTVGAPVAAGAVQRVDVTPAGVPADAIAVVVNLTATQASVGFWTAYPITQTLPNVSNINVDAPGQTRAAQAIVLLSAGSRAFNVFSLGGGELIVDVAGWFTGATTGSSLDGLFLPTNPSRLIDSRNFYALSPWAGTTLEFAVGGPVGQVSAAALNITGTEPLIGGFVTAYPSGLDRPLASNLNFDTFNQTLANHTIVRVSGRGVSLFTSNGVHMIADLNGWFLGTPSNAVLAPPANPSFGPANPTNVHMADIGVYTRVATGSNLDAVANLGIAAQWNNGVQLGSRGNIIMFGHRTTHGAPFRYINLLPYGSIVSMIGDDGHSYNYMVVRQDVTIPDYGVINAIGAASGPATIQLVACTPPGSIRFRVVTTARLVSVT